MLSTQGLGGFSASGIDKEKQREDAQGLRTSEEKKAHRKAFTHAGLGFKAWLLEHERG